MGCRVGEGVCLVVKNFLRSYCLGCQVLPRGRHNVMELAGKLPIRMVPLN